MHTPRFHLLSAFAVSLCLATQAIAAPKKIVLIAGPLDSHPPGTHEYGKNIVLLQHCLETSPDLRGQVRTEVHFDGWPAKPETLDDADTIVLTSGGSDRREEDHPLYAGDRFAQVERQMRRGCGLVLVHWSTFHPVRVHDRITEWVGGYFDYERGPGANHWYSKIETREWTATPAAPSHPVCRGVRPFKLTEEFYFNLRFRDVDPRLTPLVVKDTSGGTLPNTVAWAVERADGGRGFGFTGGHFFKNWEMPDFRRLVLNAIVWSAHLEVPAGGVESSLEPPPDFSRAPGRKPAAGPNPAAAAAAAPEDQTEPAWVDDRWNQTTPGAFQCSSLDLPNGVARKALSIQLGEPGQAAVCYDMATGNLRAGWTGGFLRFDPARYALAHKPAVAGTLRLLAPDGPGWLDAAVEYRGLELHGSRVVLQMVVDGAAVFEVPWVASDRDTMAFTRTLMFFSAPKPRRLVLPELKDSRAETATIDGIEIVRLVSDRGAVAVASLTNSGAKFRADDGRIVAEFPALRALTAGEEPWSAKFFLSGRSDLDLAAFAHLAKSNNENDVFKTLTKPNEPRWQPLATQGQPGSGAGAYVFDTLTAPYDNPWNALLFFSGIGVLPNGDIAACTIHGDVWTVSGVDDKLDRLTWRRFATGLFQPLGLVVRDGGIFVLGRDQITQLFDVNDDGEADGYACFSQRIDTSAGGHDFVTSMQADAAGNFYYVDPQGLHRIPADGRTRETIATGWRNPNGMSVNADGSVITVAPQEETGRPPPPSSKCGRAATTALADRA